jgi:hypothetical protein
MAWAREDTEKLLAQFNQDRWHLQGLYWFVRPLLTDQELFNAISNEKTWYAVSLFRRLIIEKIILSMCSFYDGGGNAWSIHRILDELGENADFRAHVQAKWDHCVDDLGQAEWLRDVPMRARRIRRQSTFFASHNDMRRVELFRDEWIAHALEASKKRKKPEFASVAGNPTYSSIFRLVRITLALADEIQNLVSASVDGGFEEIAVERSREFWTHVSKRPAVEFGSPPPKPQGSIFDP